MKITIDSNILEQHNITLEEFLVLYLGAKNADIKSISQEIIRKGLATRDLFSDNRYIVVSNKVKDLIASIIVNSDKNIVDKDEEYTRLANKLRELYPAGRKEGTTYMWRGTVSEVARKLKTLVVKYGYTINYDEVIKATKEYVNSFNGNYRYMQLLKYFILKSVRDADGNVEVKSELMSHIENSGQIDEQRSDWVSTMI
jgi:hypothetical protein